jgi:hypothetical protein
MLARPASLTTEFTIFNVSETPVTYKVGQSSFVVEPRYARTHRSGRPPTVTVQWPAESKQQPTTFDPESGMRYVIQKNAEGAFEVAKTKVEEPESPPSAPPVAP